MEGGAFVTVTNHTTYSFGIDDQEFIPAFECEEPADFMHLMMTLRETEASRWTERDTPNFVGALVDIRAALDALDGASARIAASNAASRAAASAGSSRSPTTSGTGPSASTATRSRPPSASSSSTVLATSCSSDRRGSARP